MGRRQVLGRWGEQVAENYLVAEGYKIRERNFHTPYGEIDLVAELDNQNSMTIIFVEVKTRTTRSYGRPEESVNTKKRAHLLSAVQFYMQNHMLDVNWRVDVIAIEHYEPGGKPEIIHFENAISE